MSEKFELEGELSSEDMEMILDALDHWESRDQSLLEVIDKLRHIPDPPDDMEECHREAFFEFKKHMLDQESKLKADRIIRREKAILLKAKIILLNQRTTAERVLRGE